MRRLVFAALLLSFAAVGGQRGSAPGCASTLHPGLSCDAQGAQDPNPARGDPAIAPGAALAEPGEPDRPILLKPARVFDGVTPQPHDGWVVLVRGQSIQAAGPADTVKVPEKTRVVELPDMTLLPGLIDAHTHVLLHYYGEREWDDQVLKEPQALRVCRATNHLHADLLSG